MAASTSKSSHVAHSADEMTRDELEQAIRERFDHWQHLHDEGAHDPGYADGVNMNLVRNHIIYYQTELRERSSKDLQLTMFSDDESQDQAYRPLPPEVPDFYMAQPERIRDRAKEILALYDNDAWLLYLESVQISNKKANDVLNLAHWKFMRETLREALQNSQYVRLQGYAYDPKYYQLYCHKTILCLAGQVEEARLFWGDGEPDELSTALAAAKSVREINEIAAGYLARFQQPA